MFNPGPSPVTGNGLEVLLSLSAWDETQVEALIDQFDKNKDRWTPWFHPTWPGKPQETHRKTIGKPEENGGLIGLIGSISESKKGSFYGP